MQSTNQVVIVTGASSGIGEATAQKLAAEGYQVYGGARSFEDSLKQYNGFKTLYLDLSDSDSVKHFVSIVYADAGRVDVLINNAGSAIMGAIEDTSIDQAQKIFDVNVFGWQRIMQEVLPIMRKQNSGKILNVTSIAGIFGLPFRGWYSASKSALESLAESIRYEVEPFNIQVCSIRPGDVKTNIGAHRLVAEKGDQSAYSGVFTKHRNKIDADVNHGISTEFIANKLYKILQRKRLPTVAVIGNTLQQIAAGSYSVIPYRMFHWIIKKNYDLE